MTEARPSTRLGRPAKGRDIRRLYSDLAWTWPIISPPEEYAGEAEEFRALLLEHAKVPVHTLLDLGCGGGHNDATFKRWFRVTGVDMSEPMLRLARTRNPEASYHRGDMRTIRLPESYDAVVIADSIDYMLTPDELRAAFRTAFDHLRPGGVLATYVEHEPETFPRDRARTRTHARDDVQITLVEDRYDPDPTDGTFELTLVYLIRRGGRLEIEIDRHVNNLFPLAVWREALRHAGFEVVEIRRSFGDPEGRKFPAFIGKKPLPGESASAAPNP